MDGPLCWSCGKHLDLPEGKARFRTTCQQCDSWIHCCLGCKNYKAGLPNSCMIPGTEYVSDREGANFCDEFVLLGKGPEKTADIKDIERRLFGDD